MSVATILFYGLVLYVVAGVVTGLAFVTVGVGQVFPHTSATTGARILWLPGAALLLPAVRTRWSLPRAARECARIVPFIASYGRSWR